MKKSICVMLTIVLLAGIFAGCGGGDKIVIASKQFTENILLSEIYAQLIEKKTDIKVERKQNLGGTLVCFPALDKGEVDMYFEYSGTAYNEIFKMSGSGDLGAEEIFKRVVDSFDSKNDITMFSSIGINNTFAIAMKRSKAAELGVSAISDLSNIDGLRFGCGHLFYDRELDGYAPMVELYDLNFADVVRMDISLLYDAVDMGQVDVIVVYATDSLLKKYDMVLLEDDKSLFPVYQGAPIIRNAVLEKYPELYDILDLLKDRISDERMQELNYEVDVNGKTPGVVAGEFIAQEGLLD